MPARGRVTARHSLWKYVAAKGGSSRSPLDRRIRPSQGEHSVAWLKRRRIRSERWRARGRIPSLDEPDRVWAWDWLYNAHRTPITIYEHLLVDEDLLEEVPPEHPPVVVETLEDDMTAYEAVPELIRFRVRYGEYRVHHWWPGLWFTKKQWFDYEQRNHMPRGELWAGAKVWGDHRGPPTDFRPQPVDLDADERLEREAARKGEEWFPPPRHSDTHYVACP